MAESKIQSAFSDLVEDIDRNKMRNIQHEMHLCAAQCCSNKAFNSEATHKCIENCSVPLRNSQNIMTNELNELQGRIQRCIQSCTDKAKDKFMNDNSENKVQMYQAELTDCASACVDHHIELFPSYKKRIYEAIGRLA